MKQLQWNDDQAFTMDQGAQIIGVQRSTATGYVHRYPSLKIDAVTPGSTRRLSINQVTALCLVRQMTRAKLESGVIACALDPLRTYAWEKFLASQATAIEYEVRPLRNGVEQMPKRRFAYDFEVKNFATFVSVSFVNEQPNTVFINDHPTRTAEMVLDLQSYPLPTVIIPLDRVLKVCWARALMLANDEALTD